MYTDLINMIRFSLKFNNIKCHTSITEEPKYLETGLSL